MSLDFAPTIRYFPVNPGSLVAFQDRQTVKRRHARIENRFETMDAVERNELLRRLNHRFGAGPTPV